MTITFSLSPAVAAPQPMATINARQLATFRSFLRTEGFRRIETFIDPFLADDEPLSYNFEARVCPFSLATVCRIFDLDTAVIAVVEGAQFRGKRVLVWRDPASSAIRMRVSRTSDRGHELQLANGNAYALLEALGIEPECTGSACAADLRLTLSDPETRTRLESHGMGNYAGQLDRLLGEPEANFSETLMTWA